MRELGLHFAFGFALGGLGATLVLFIVACLMDLARKNNNMKKTTIVILLIWLFVGIYGWEWLVKIGSNVYRWAG